MFPPPSRAAGARRRRRSPPRRPSRSKNWPRAFPEGLDALHPARLHARRVASRHRDSPDLGLGRQGGAGAMLASDRPTRGRIGQHDQIQLFERPRRYAGGSNWPRCRATLLVERAFEDGKGECGLADYQALGWRSWHHHVTMVILAMLFILEQRVAQQPGLELLTPRDIVECSKRLFAAQAGRKGGAGGANQRTPPAPPRRHRIPFPHQPGGIRVRQRLWQRCDSVKLGARISPGNPHLDSARVP